MLEWPDGFGLAIQFFGIVVLLLAGSGIRASWPRWLVTVILGCACVHYILYAPHGNSQSGLLVYDQVTLSFVQGYLFFLFLELSLGRGGEISAQKESAPLTLCASLLGSYLLIANNLTVMVIGLPCYLLLALTGPSTGRTGQSPKSGMHAVSWSVLILVLLGLGAGLMVAGGGALQLSHLPATAAPMTKTFLVGWSIVASVLLVLLFLFPCSFLLTDFRDARDWHVASVFKIAPSLVFSALVVRWCLMLPGFPEPQHLQILAASFSVFVAVILYFGQGLLFAVHALALLPSQFWLWSLSDTRTMPLALASVFLFSVALPRLIFLIEHVGAGPNDSIQELHKALRAASFGIRLEVFALGVSLMPLGSFLGFNFLVQKPMLASICGASLTLVVVLFLGRTLGGDSNVRSGEVRLNQVESALGVIIIVALIVLGIYPTPLYNYIHLLTQHP
jgi:hypothetical protein